jgi:hypothetical protein
VRNLRGDMNHIACGHGLAHAAVNGFPGDFVERGFIGGMVSDWARRFNAHRGPGAPLAQALRKHRERSVQTDWPSIVKMLVQLPVLGVALFVANPGRFSMRRAEVCLPGTCRAYRAQRDLLFQVAAMAGGAFRGGRRRQDQVLETVSAFAACVFVDWHERSLSFHAGVNDPQCCCRLTVSSLLELPPFGVH